MKELKKVFCAMLNDNAKVKIGDKVTVALNGQVRNLEIVALPNGDLSKGLISYLSPIAKAILGHSYPEKITVKLPNGNLVDCQLLRPRL
ncbi:MAG: GreA/GreB family elongation factor [Patescibacteria group bacterium]|jgi:transcription elongation GreA/GreB family factor|nr:GreA/GreB family elongation factor [Patescibacteria group bacterium]